VSNRNIIFLCSSFFSGSCRVTWFQWR